MDKVTIYDTKKENKIEILDYQNGTTLQVNIQWF